MVGHEVVNIERDTQVLPNFLKFRWPLPGRQRREAVTVFFHLFHPSMCRFRPPYLNSRAPNMVPAGMSCLGSLHGKYSSIVKFSLQNSISLAHSKYVTK